MPCLSIPIPSNLEVITVKVSISNTEVLIRTAYCPPNPNPTYLKCLVDFLISLSQNEKNLIITGDFNLPDICWSSLSGHSPISNLFCDFVFESNLSQLISGPTHIKGNTLDLLLTNNEHLVSQLSGQSSPSAQLSDHFNISFHIVSCAPTSKRCELLFVFDYSKADFAGLCNYLLDIDYSVCLQSDSIEYVWSYYPLWYGNVYPKKVDEAQIFSTLVQFGNSSHYKLSAYSKEKPPTPNSLSKIQSLESHLSSLIISAK